MGYFYGVIWLLIGLILIFSLSKENKVFYIVGGYFLLLSAWWIANELLPAVDLFAGGWGIAFKVISGAAVLFLVIFYYRNFWKPRRDGKK